MLSQLGQRSQLDQLRARGEWGNVLHPPLVASAARIPAAHASFDDRCDGP